MSKKNCFAYISGNKCACLSVMNCYSSDSCCFFKTKTQFLEDQWKSDIDTFLINKGKDISPQKKFKMVVVNPFTRTIKYWTKNTSNRIVKYVFYTKDNIFEEFPSKCSQNSKNTL